VPPVWWYVCKLCKPPSNRILQDGSAATARVVVGADGNMSSVRGSLFEGELPEYIGAWLGWRLRRE